MTAWSEDELNRIGAADELELASLRDDGSLSSTRTIWVARLGDDLYVRSVRGTKSEWFRGTRIRHEGHVEAGGVDKDVTFVDADPALNDAIDAEYRAKYGHYPANIVDPTLTPDARTTTLKLVPRESGH